MYVANTRGPYRTVATYAGAPPPWWRQLPPRFIILAAANHHAVMVSFRSNANPGRRGGTGKEIEPLNDGKIEDWWESPSQITSFDWS